MILIWVINELSELRSQTNAMRGIVTCLFWFCSGVVTVHARTAREFRVQRAAVPPKIDGDLSDEVFGKGRSAGHWRVDLLQPPPGERNPQRTEVRIAYDDRYIYFAFHCFDSEPGKIRTTISRRDSVFNDDWIGLSWIRPARARLPITCFRIQVVSRWTLSTRIVRRAVRGGPSMGQRSQAYR